MMNPFEKLLKEICEALNKLIKMVIFVAERTLSAKEFTEFTEEFTKKTDRKNVSDLFRELEECDRLTKPHWKKDIVRKVFECSVCGEPTVKRTPFCPMCGAKMEDVKA